MTYIRKTENKNGKTVWLVDTGTNTIYRICFYQYEEQFYDEAYSVLPLRKDGAFSLETLMQTSVEGTRDEFEELMKQRFEFIDSIKKLYYGNEA